LAISSHTCAWKNKVFKRRWDRLCTIISCMNWVYGTWAVLDWVDGAGTLSVLEHITSGL
jgi:hypothetical protein